MKTLETPSECRGIKDEVLSESDLDLPFFNSPLPSIGLPA